MMKRKEIILKATCLCLLLFFLVGVLSSCAFSEALASLINPPNGLEEFLSEWEPTDAENVAIHYGGWDVIMENQRVDIEEPIRNFYKIPTFSYSFPYWTRNSKCSDQGFCIYDNTLFCLAISGVKETDENGKTTWSKTKKWEILTIDLGTMEVEAVCSGFWNLYNPDNPYGEFRGGEISFYQDGKIYVKEEARTVICDVRSGTVEEKASDFFDGVDRRYTVRQPVSWEAVYWLSTQTDERILNLEYLTECSSHLKQAREAEIPCQLEDVQIYDGAVYITCSVMDDLGRHTALLFRYDPETESMAYLNRYFTKFIPSDYYDPIAVLGEE